MTKAIFPIAPPTLGLTSYNAFANRLSMLYGYNQEWWEQALTIYHGLYPDTPVYTWKDIDRSLRGIWWTGDNGDDIANHVLMVHRFFSNNPRYAELVLP